MVERSLTEKSGTSAGAKRGWSHRKRTKVQPDKATNVGRLIGLISGFRTGSPGNRLLKRYLKYKKRFGPAATQKAFFKHRGRIGRVGGSLPRAGGTPGGLAAGRIRHHLNVIRSVHKVDELPNIPIKSNLFIHRGLNAAYSFNGGPRKIDISHGTPHPMNSLFHEYGHFIDHSKFGWGSEGSRKFAALNRAIDRTAAVQKFKFVEKHGYLPIGNGRGLRVHPSVPAYYLSRRELFARAYSQYIAVKSGNWEARRELSRLQKSLFPIQWSNEDFAPVMRAMDDLFRSEGWLN